MCDMDSIAESEAAGVRFDVARARLISAGRVLPDAGWSTAAHSHDCWEFIYFVRGTGRIDTPRATLRPQAYQLVVYPPGLSHAEVSSPVDPEQTIYFSADIPGAHSPGTHVLLADPDGELGWLAERIIAETETRGTTRLAQAYANSFLLLTERLWDTGVPVRQGVVELATQYIYANYAENISTQSLAEALHVSVSHLIHSFTARVGVSPLKYLRMVRIETARRLMMLTEMPVGEVAARVGFADPLYFSRAFRQAVGVSPSEYRRKRECAIESIRTAE